MLSLRKKFHSRVFIIQRENVNPVIVTYVDDSHFTK